MGFVYYCVNCGAELRETEQQIDISELVYDGAIDSVLRKSTLFIPLSTLNGLMTVRGETFSNRTKVFITMKEVFQWAYAPANCENYKNNPASNYEEAYKLYENSINQKEKKSSSALDDKSILQDGKTAYNDDLSSAISGNLVGISEILEERLDTVVQDHIREVNLPGFSNDQKTQLLSNFSGDKCYFYLELSEECAYQFQLEKPGHNVRFIKEKYCPNCHEDILEHAFRREHRLIGLFGFRAVGKSCLITAMVHYLTNELKEKKGHDHLIKKHRDEFELQLKKNYQQGRALATTQKNGTNTTNPSVLYNNVLWTFVDLCGEAIWNSQTNQTNPEIILQSFKALLKCRIYLMCVSENVYMNDSKSAEMEKAIDFFFRFISRETKKLSPMMLLMTQVDEGIQDDVFPDGERNYNSNEYKYHKHYETLMKRNLSSLISQVSEKVYLTPMVCSAYGTDPIPWKEDNVANMRGEDLQKKEIFPKHIGDIIEWIEVICGDKPVCKYNNTDEMCNCIELYREPQKYSEEESTGVSKKLFKHKQKRNHDVKAMAIAKMFCNPMTEDNEKYEKISKSCI